MAMLETKPPGRPYRVGTGPTPGEALVVFAAPFVLVAVVLLLASVAAGHGDESEDLLMTGALTVPAAGTISQYTLIGFDFGENNAGKTPAQIEQRMHETIWAFAETGTTMPEIPESGLTRFCDFSFQIKEKKWCLTLHADRPRLKRLR